MAKTLKLEPNWRDYDRYLKTPLYKLKSEVGFFVLWGLAGMNEENNNQKDKAKLKQVQV